MKTNLYFELYFEGKSKPRKIYVMPDSDALDTLILWVDNMENKLSLNTVKLIFNGKTVKRYSGWQIFSAPNYYEILNNAKTMKDRAENLEYLMNSLFN